MTMRALVLLVPFCAALGAGELRPLPWSAEAAVPARFVANASGEMTVAADAAEKAIRFEVVFTPGTDFWAYPALRLRDGESLADVDEIRFAFKARQGDPGAGYRFANVMFGDEQPFFRLPDPAEAWQDVVIDVAKAVKNPAAAKSLRIGMNPRDAKLTFWIRDLVFLTRRDLPARATRHDAADVLRPAAPAAAFLSGEPLRFGLRPTAAAASGKRWTLRDWRGGVLREGAWPTGGELVLEPLSNGYYTLALAADDTEFAGVRGFAVVPDPAARPDNPDLYFAMDSAQSWLARPDANNPRQPANPYEVVAETARRAGLGMVRERMNWGEVEPEPGRFDWRQYKTNARLLAARGVRVLGMYHHAPGWVKTDTASLPSDLVAAYRFAKRAAETFKGEMTAWEFWNEPDIGFSRDAAWDYAAALKAASLGFKAADPALPVLIGGYAMTPVLPFADAVMACGAAEYFDVFNIHTYRTLPELPDVLASVRAHLERHGIGDRPVWFTENGSAVEGSGRIDGFIPGLKAHDPEQEMLVAEYLPKLMVAMQALGVARDFFFVLPPYNESGGNKDWGLMRRDFTVKPGFAAFATLVDHLGGATPKGEARLDEGLKGFLYRRADGTDALVYWSLSELDREARARPGLTNRDGYERRLVLPFPGRVKGVEAFGTPFAADAASVPADRYPRILFDVKGLDVKTPAVRPGVLAPARESRFDKAVVFRTVLSPDFKPLLGKDGADVAKDGGARFTLQVWNLSDHVKEGTVSVAGGRCDGLPAGVSVPAFGKAEFALTFTPELDMEFRGVLRIEGVFGDRPATPHVVPLRCLEEIAGSGPKLELAAALDPANWRKNASGTMDIAYDAAEKAVRFATRFPAGVDRWSYPEYVLQVPQESLDGAIGIGFEVKVSRAPAVRQMLLMTVMGTEREAGKAHYHAVEAPKEVWETRFVPLPPEPDPAGVRQLRLGVNATENDIVCWVRAVRVFYRR